MAIFMKSFMGANGSRSQFMEKASPIKIFYSYAHEDEALRKELEKQLSILRRQGKIIGWHDRNIGAGKNWRLQIDANLNAAHIILLLVSPDFVDSDYCYSIEMKRALERHSANEALVIPVILRPVLWEDAPFGELQALPMDGKPVTLWLDRDEAFWDVAKGIRNAVKELTINIELDSFTQITQIETSIDFYKASLQTSQQYLNMLKQGVPFWNEWRAKHPEVEPNLSDANFNNTDLSDANLSRINLDKATLRGANLRRANLSDATLREADLSDANLSDANLSNADLHGAKLITASLVRTNLNGANLTNCSIYGVSAWDVQMEGTAQSSLIITPSEELIMTVDNLQLAQFISLLMDNRSIRDVIDTMTHKVVLILGNFKPTRKEVLNALRDDLRRHDYLPVMFDFEKPNSRDFTETVRTLAHLSRFVIADLTEPSSIPQELYAVVPSLAVPVQPLLQLSVQEPMKFGMFDDLMRYHWVLPVFRYTDQAMLLRSLREYVIAPAEKKAQELAMETAKGLERP